MWIFILGQRGGERQINIRLEIMGEVRITGEDRETLMCGQTQRIKLKGEITWVKLDISSMQSLPH